MAVALFGDLIGVVSALNTTSGRGFTVCLLLVVAGEVDGYSAPQAQPTSIPFHDPRYWYIYSIYVSMHNLSKWNN